MADRESEILKGWAECLNKNEFVELCCKQELRTPLTLCFEMLYDYLNGGLTNDSEN